MILAAQPIFVKEAKGAGSDYGIKQSYVNINDVASLEQISEDHWEAKSLSGQKTPNGQEKVYHFDNNGAQQILNYMA